MHLVRLAPLTALCLVATAVDCEPPPPARAAPAPTASTATTETGAAPVASTPPVDSASSARAASAASAASASPPAAPPATFVADVASAAPSPMPSVGVSVPQKDQVVPADKAADLEIKWKASSWKLEGGKTVRLVLDGRASLSVGDPAQRVHLKDIDPSPAAVAPGAHLLVALVCLPSGECVKPVGKRVPAAVVPFYVGQRTARTWKDGAPLLVWAGPPPGPAPPEGLLVDFYVLYAELGDRTYSVHAAVTGPNVMTGEAIHAWQPWRIKGAQPGAWTVRLELFHFEHELGQSGSTTTVVMAPKPVEGPWSSVTRDFTLP